MSRKILKLQKKMAGSNKLTNKQRFSYFVTVPEKMIKDLKWKEGDELKPSVIGNVLTFEKQ